MPGLIDSFDPLNPYIGADDPDLMGRVRGSPAAGNPIQADEANPLLLTRERIQDELANNPKLQRELDRNTTAEVGTDPAKRRWYQALTIDRAVQEKKPLADIVNNPDYYPPRTLNYKGQLGMGVDPSLFAGANPANFATGNASRDPVTGRDVAFAGGPQTTSFGSERGGIEGQRGLPYARAVGYTGPNTTPIGFGAGAPQGYNSDVPLGATDPVAAQAANPGFFPINGGPPGTAPYGMPATGNVNPENYDPFTLGATPGNLMPPVAPPAAVSSTSPTTGKRPMPQGIIDSLQQQPQAQPGQNVGGQPGLLGALTDPETIGYLAMIAKGLNPYSSLDPAKLLKMAHDRQEAAQKLAQQQAQHLQDLGVRRDQLGISQQQANISQGNLDVTKSRDAREQAKLDEQQKKEASQLEEYRRLNAPAVPAVPAAPAATPAVPDAGAPGAQGQFGQTEEPPPDQGPALGAAGAFGQTAPVPSTSFQQPTTAPAIPAPAPAPTPETPAIRIQKIQTYLDQFPDSKFSPMLEREKEKLVAQEEKRGEPARLRAQREDDAAYLGIKRGTKQWQNFMASGKADKPEISPGDATKIQKAEDELVTHRSNLRDLQEAVELTPKSLTGPFAETRAKIGAFTGQFIPGLDIDNSPAAATRRLNQILQSTAIDRMAQTLKGSDSDRDMKRFLGIAADLSELPSTRLKNLNAAIKTYEDFIHTKEQRVDQLRGGDYYGPQGGDTGRRAGSTPPTAKPTSAPSGEKRVIDGKSYRKIDGQWYED